MVNRVISGDMGFLEFANAQEPEVQEDYRNWCREHNLAENETSAELFLRATEKALMEAA